MMQYYFVIQKYICTDRRIGMYT